MYADTLYTAPTLPPVTIDEMRKQLSLGDISAHDTMLLAYIQAATDYVERYCNRALVTQTRELQLDQFPCGNEPIYLRPPLVSVTSIVYLAAADGASTTWTSSEYRVLTSTEPGRIVPAFNCFYPVPRYIAGAVTVRYVCGAAVASVPEALKAAVKLIVTNLFESRGGEMYLSDAVKFLLESYRVPDDFLRYEREAESQNYEPVY